MQNAQHMLQLWTMYIQIRMHSPALPFFNHMNTIVSYIHVYSQHMVKYSRSNYKNSTVNSTCTCFVMTLSKRSTCEFFVKCGEFIIYNFTITIVEKYTFAYSLLLFIIRVQPVGTHVCSQSIAAAVNLHAHA